MKKIYLLIVLLISINASATIWPVEAGGGGVGNPDPYFSPNVLFIEVGDTVQWNNVQGKHSIDGTDPDNPETFMYPEEFAVWTFEFQFTIPGVYYVECSVSNHALTQNMDIFVEGVNPVDITEFGIEEFILYPNPLPASSSINLPIGDDEIQRISIINEVGQIVKNIEINGSSNVLINGRDFEKGLYIIAWYQNEAIVRKSKLLIN